VVPVCTQILADTLTPVSLLARFYEGKGPIFLLESVEGGERWARYSFLGFSAHLIVRVFADRVDIEEAGRLRRIPHGGKPFQVLRELLAPYRPADVFGLPRFWGGLVGHLNYEMVSFLEAIPHRWPADKPLACFMVPETVLIFDNARHTLLLAALTFPNGDPERDWSTCWRQSPPLCRAGPLPPTAGRTSPRRCPRRSSVPGWPPSRTTSAPAT
jgi:anthranilate synthase component 1